MKLTLASDVVGARSQGMWQSCRTGAACERHGGNVCLPGLWKGWSYSRQPVCPQRAKQQQQQWDGHDAVVACRLQQL